jgi:protocatechuate 3,4-dioxygenase, beta subunit
VAFSRRGFIGAMGASALFSSVGHAVERLRPTPQETLGPFYPMRLPQDHDADLTHVAGQSGVAKGQIMSLSGRVVRPDGSPIEGAEIKVWQANAAGRYTHPLDNNSAPLDPNFDGIALIKSDGAGRYRILTIKPGAYPTPSGDMRAPHIHFDVSSGDYRLVTQMYFPDEALNASDLLIRTMPPRGRDPALATCRKIASPEQGIMAFEWNIVLLQA